MVLGAVNRGVCLQTAGRGWCCCPSRRSGAQVSEGSLRDVRDVRRRSERSLSMLLPGVRLETRKAGKPHRRPRRYPAIPAPETEEHTVQSGFVYFHGRNLETTRTTTPESERRETHHEETPKHDKTRTSIKTRGHRAVHADSRSLRRRREKPDQPDVADARCTDRSGTRRRKPSRAPTDDDHRRHDRLERYARGGELEGNLDHPESVGAGTRPDPGLRRVPGLEKPGRDELDTARGHHERHRLRRFPRLEGFGLRHPHRRGMRRRNLYLDLGLEAQRNVQRRHSGRQPVGRRTGKP